MNSMIEAQRPLRIALTSFYLPPGDKMGVGYQAHYMANALAKRGHWVCMHSPASKPPDAEYEHRQVDPGKRFRLHGFAASLSKLDLSGFDVLHSHGECQWLWRQPRSLRAKVHVRTIHGSCMEEAWHIRGLAQKIRMLYIAAMESVAYLAADATVAVSENSRKYAPWISRVIPNGVDLSAFQPGVKEPNPTVLFVGTLGNRKRGKWLLHLFENQVLPKVPNARLWMVSDNDGKNYKNVSFLGRLSTYELAVRFSRAWVFCLPSTYEGFGVPYIESMASGTAVVASPNVGAREVLENGKWGIIAPDITFADALVSVLTKEDLRRELENKSLERAQCFSWEMVLESYERVYSQFLLEKL